MQTKPIGAKLNIAGTLEWRDKDGNILKTTELRGSVPLSELGLTEEQAKQLTEQANGPDHRQ